MKYLASAFSIFLEKIKILDETWKNKMIGAKGTLFSKRPHGV
jgi:hypothetical protein